MKISYLITTHNEDLTLENCLSTIFEYKDKEDEIIIVDDYSTNNKTLKILEDWKDIASIFKHPLNNNYSEHKNWGNDQATGDWVFQIDGDEVPLPELLINIKNIIDSNPEIELFLVPRINDFIGVNEEHAKKWGWNLTPCSKCDGRLIVSWPDYQSRLYKRVPERIKWKNRLHERINGADKCGVLPADMDLALYHTKTIEKQTETNLRYNRDFTEEENRGISNSRA